MKDESPSRPVKPIELDEERLDDVSGGKPKAPPPPPPPPPPPTGGNHVWQDDWLAPT